MYFDFDAEPNGKEETNAARPLETRCYTVTGPPLALDCLESLVRGLAREERDLRRRDAGEPPFAPDDLRILVRVLASWIEE